jgi:ribosomal protein S18 acetylase RimI-like enzyme
MVLPPDTDARPMIVRPATLADVPRLIALFQQAIAHQRQLATFFDLTPSVDWERFAEAKLRHPRERVLVAEWDAEVVGYIDVRMPFSPRHGRLRRMLRRLVSAHHTPTIVQPRRAGWIEDCYVQPQARRRGIGRALVQAALAWFRARHVTRVDLAVLVANREGLAFWEKQGFAPLRMLLSQETE